MEKSFPQLDVLNFGLPGSGTDQQLLVYENIAKPFEADAYIFAICTTNILRNQVGMLPTREPGANVVWFRSKPFFTLEEDRLVLHNQPVPNERISEQEALRRLGAGLALGEISPARRLALRLIPRWMQHITILQRISAAAGQQYRGYESADAHSWRLMRAIVERFTGQVCEKPVFILPVPIHHHVVNNLRPTYMSRFAALEEPAKLRFVVDILPYFRRLSPQTRRACYFKNDVHYSPFGHAIIFEAISDTLSRLYPEIMS